MSSSRTIYGRLRMERRARKRVNLSRSRAGTVAIFLFLCAIGVFMALPLVYSVVQAFKPLNEIYAYPPRFFVINPTWDNFHMVFKLAANLGIPFSRYVFNSVFVAVVGTGFDVVIASLAAYPLAKARFPGRAVLMSLIVWTLLFRQEVTAIPQYIIIAKLGMVNTYQAIILPLMASTFGVFLMKQFMDSSIPQETLEAARLDGAGELSIFWRIVMPCMKPAWLTLIIFTFQNFWNSTGVQYIYDESLKMLPNVLSQIAAGGIARAGAGSAVSLILMIPPIAIFIISQSSVMETMAHSGLK